MQNIERAVAMAAAAILLKRERRSARTLLKSEGRMLARLRGAARPVIARATGALEHGDRRQAMATVRRTVPLLQRSVERAIADGRADTRALARRDLATELPAAEPSALSGREEDDAASAHTAAASYASAWGAAAMAAVIAESDEPVGTQDHRLRRTAATESAAAFNDERRRLYDELDDAPGMFKVWSAVLDRKTCHFCFGKDGQTARLHASLGETPPVHPFCRCTIELVSLNLRDFGEINLKEFQAAFREELLKSRSSHADRRSVTRRK